MTKLNPFELAKQVTPETGWKSTDSGTKINVSTIGATLEPTDGPRVVNPLAALITKNSGGNLEESQVRAVLTDRRPQDEPELLDALNSCHFVAVEGGKTRVFTQTHDPALKREVLDRSSFEDFRNFYVNKRIVAGYSSKGVPKEVPAGRWWLEHPNRLTFQRVAFLPGQVAPDGTYNLWRGWETEAVEGDWSLFRTHIRDVICSGDEECYSYLLGWMARTVQRPSEPGQVAVVLRGGRGTGKGIFARDFGALFGQHHMHISSSKHLTGNFNAHLQDCLLLFADEAFWAGDKQGESTLKALITEPTMTVEPKGVNAFQAPNHIHLIMASNKEWVVPAGGDERRFLVLDVSDVHQQDRTYFGAIERQMHEEGGLEAMLHDLMEYDLSDFDVWEVPNTEALVRQKAATLEPPEQWWLSKLEEGRVLPFGDAWPTKVSSRALHQDFVKSMGNAGWWRGTSSNALGLLIKRVTLGKMIRKQNVKMREPGVDGYMRDVTRNAYFLPDLEEARDAFQRITGVAVEEFEDEGESR